MHHPDEVYVRSHSEYPRKLLDVRSCEPFAHAARVDRNGFIKWRRRNVFISSALKHEIVGLEIDHEDDERWIVSWGPILLGYLDERRRTDGLMVPRRHRAPGGITRMSIADAIY